MDHLTRPFTVFMVAIHLPHSKTMLTEPSSNQRVGWSGWTDGQTYDTPDGVKKTSLFFVRTNTITLEVTASDGSVRLRTHLARNSIYG